MIPELPLFSFLLAEAQSLLQQEQKLRSEGVGIRASSGDLAQLMSLIQSPELSLQQKGIIALLKSMVEVAEIEAQAMGHRAKALRLLLCAAEGLSSDTAGQSPKMEAPSGKKHASRSKASSKPCARGQRSKSGREATA